VWHIVIACSRHDGAFCWCYVRCGEETKQDKYQISTSKHAHASVWLHTELVLHNKQVLTICSTFLVRDTTVVLTIRAGIWWWPLRELRSGQWQIPRNEQEGVKFQKTILHIIKEDRVIKMDKEPWRNKNTGKNFSYFFHLSSSLVSASIILMRSLKLKNSVSTYPVKKFQGHELFQHWIHQQKVSNI